jgi:hypothetical protein
LTALQQNLENRLSELGGSRAQVESDIAKAKLAGQQNVASAEFSQESAKEAAAAQAQAAKDAAANKPPVYAKSRTGWEQQVADAGGEPKSIMNAVTRMIDAIRKKEGITDETIAIPKALMLKYWMQYKPFAESQFLPYALEYIDKYAGVR